MQWPDVPMLYKHESEESMNHASTTIHVLWVHLDSSVPYLVTSAQLERRRFQSGTRHTASIEPQPETPREGTSDMAAAGGKATDGDVGASTELACCIPWPAVPMVYDYRGGDFMYVRECYDPSYRLIEGRVLAKKRVVTVTGTPGIGKSVFYGYFFDRLRREHPEFCVIAVASSGKVPQSLLLCKGDGSHPDEFDSVERPLTEDPDAVVRVMAETARAALLAGRQVVYLCDGQPDGFRPDTCVVFSSPNEALMKLTMKIDETYYMSVWTLEELYEAATVLDLPITKSELTADTDNEPDVFAERNARIAEIKTRFWVFGGVPRFCLHPDPVAVVHAAIRLDRAIDKIEDLTKLNELFKEEASTDVCHRLLHFEPMDATLKMETTHLGSWYVKKKVALNLLARYRSEREQMPLTLRDISGAESFYGFLFEIETHEVLRAGCTLQVRPLVASGANSVGSLGHVRIDATTPPFVEFKTAATAMLTGGPYHKPVSKVWESIDSFYLPTWSITVSATHDVNALGIIHVLERLGLLEKVADNPDRAALVFIVPKNRADGFKHQTIVVPDANGGNLITSMQNMGKEIASTLSKYEIRTVDELQAKMKAFDDKTFEVESSHRVAWMRAYSAAVKHGLDSAGAKFGRAIANIPQYVCTWEGTAQSLSTPRVLVG